jgi:hypothetical protein
METRKLAAAAAVRSLNKVLENLNLLNLAALSPRNINFSEDVKLIARFGKGDATLQDIAKRVLVLHGLMIDTETITGAAEHDIRDAILLNYFSLGLNEAINADTNAVAA